MDYTNTVREAVKFIHNHYRENITVADIAGQAYLSPSYFSAVFRRLTGYTVKDYLLKYRLYMTAVELRDTKKQIFTVSLENGFASQQAFTKSFTQEFGFTPARFRRLDLYAREPSRDPMDEKFISPGCGEFSKACILFKKMLSLWK